MRKQISFALALLLLIMGIMAVVSAGAVELEIITYANHDVTVNILDPNKEDALYTFEDNTGQDAKVTFNFETTASKIDISVLVRKNGKLIVFKKFTGYTPSGPISLRVLKEDVTTANQTNQTASNATNQTATNNTNQTAPNTTSTTTPTTNSSSPEPQISNNETDAGMPKYFSDFPIIKIVIYAIIILALVFIIAGIILFFVFRKKAGIPKEIKVKKYSELKEEIKERNKTEDEKKIAELENKINGLKEEVEEIKNKKSKIKEVEERLKRDMAELERLKK